MAYAALMTIPLVIVFLLFQRYFVQGVASSGVKG
jgi:multiple sugar transport system permease protein